VCKTVWQKLIEDKMTSQAEGFSTLAQSQRNNWQKIAKRPMPKGGEEFSPFFFKKKRIYNCYVSIAEELLNSGECDEDAANKIAYKSAVLFQDKERVARYLEKHGQGTISESLDIIQLPAEHDDQRINWENWGSAVICFGPKMVKLAQHADILHSPRKSHDKSNWQYWETLWVVNKLTVAPNIHLDRFSRR
jgi:hypothetical protein